MHRIFVIVGLTAAISCGAPAATEENIPEAQHKIVEPAPLATEIAAPAAVGPVVYPASTAFEPEGQRALFARLREVKDDKQRDTNATRIPIFIMTCDRISVLIQSMLSYYTRLDTPVEVVIHDNNSTYPPTCAFLDRLEAAGVMVVRSGRDVIQASSLSDLNETIQAWYQTHDAPYYIVTDPDIEVEQGSPDLLELLAHLLETHTNINVAGPMLRTNDLPDHYPFKDYVPIQQADVYRGQRTWNMFWKGQIHAISMGYIDTAFGMYRKGFDFHNYNAAVQTMSPYRARHLDWYIDPSNLAPDQTYYKQRNNPVGHWSSTFFNDPSGVPSDP